MARVALLAAFGLSAFLLPANAHAIVATGGTVTDSAGYRTHTFNSNGTFTVTSAGAGANTVEVIAVGGGAGGNTSCWYNELWGMFTCSNGTGGGGSTPVRNAALGVSATSYAVTVGAGGAGAVMNWVSGIAGASGGNSSFASSVSSAGGTGSFTGSGCASGCTWYGVTYGAKGATGSRANGAANSGNGGGGGTSNDSAGAGGSGRVIVRYQIEAAPTNSAAPTISGTTRVGQVLTAASGTWAGFPTPTYAYKWQVSSDGSTGWTDISGATASTYTLTSSEAGKYVRVQVTGTNGQGSATASSAASAQITQVPANTVAPSVSGSTLAGSTLTATSGTWSGAPTPTYAYQWQVSADGSTGWSNISGATSSTYVIDAAHGGKYLRVQVTGTNTAGSATASSAATAQVTVDTTPPAVSWSSVPSSPTNSSTLSYQLTSSETLSGFAAGDLSNAGTATGCSFSISGSSSPYSVTVSSCSEGTVVLRLASGSVADAAGNTAPASNLDASSVTVDRTSPTVTWSSVPSSPTNSSTLTYQLTSSEALTGLTNADITQASGTATGCSFSVSGSSSPYTVSATGCSEGTLALRLTSGSVADAAGNVAPASNLDSSSVSIDRTAPTVSWSSTPSSPSNLSSLSYQLSSTETLSGLANSDITNTGTATGCSISVSGSSSPYSVSVSSCSEGTVVLRLSSGSVSDAAGNTAPASNLDASAVTVDRTPPTITWGVTPTSPTNASSLTYQIDFNENVTGLTSADFSNTGTATGCVFTPSSSTGSTLSVVVSSCSEGTLTLVLGANAVSDASGNIAPSSAMSASSVTVDRTAPTPSFTEPASPSGDETLNYQLAFDESVSGLTSADFSNTGTATGCVFTPDASSGSSFSVSVSSCSEGTLTLRLASGAVSDSAGNSSAQLDGSEVVIARGPATVSFTEPSSPTNASSLSFGLAFSKPVTGLTASDLSNIGTATGCSISVSGSGDSYTATVASCSGGTVRLRLAAESTANQAGGHLAPEVSADSAAVTIDRTAPTAVWSQVPDSPTGADSLEYQLTFSEQVSGLTSADFSNTGTATGCSFSAASASGEVITVTVSGCQSGSLVLRLASGAVVDEAGNSGPSASLSASSVTVALIPVNSVAPALSGEAKVGEVMTASSGTWSRSPSYAYQWQVSNDGSAGWSNIAGASSASYTLASAQAGKYVRVQVTATNAVGSATAYSSAAGAVTQAPAASVSPSVSGMNAPTYTLTLSPGTWAGTPEPTLAYQWQYCDSDGLNCQDIDGETSLTYVIAEADKGYRIRAKVTGSNAAGDADAYSAPTQVVADRAPAPPSLTSDISITSSPEAGNQASTDGGTWDGFPEPTLDYQWQVCEVGGDCVDAPSQQAALDTAQLAGQAKDYTPTTERAGKQLRVRVTATNSEGSVSENSARSNPVRARPWRIGNLSFGGAAAVGQVLVANPGSWGGYPIPTYTFGWQLCDKDGDNCSSIAGATAGYRGQLGHVGKRLKFTVTASNPLGSESATSSTSPQVQGAPINTALPEVSGDALAGQTLTASTGSWDSSPEASYLYQWQRCDRVAARCANVPGSTAPTYTLSALDAGVRMRVRVNAINPRGQTASFSAIGSVVSAPLSMSVAPSISGATIVGRSVAAVPGRWSGFPLPSISYQWQRCEADSSGCSDISGQTSGAYSMASADYGKRLKLKVVASNALGSQTAFSAVSPVVGSPPIMDEAPEIIGEAHLGETLEVDEGAWQSATAPRYSYQWQQCNADGAGCKDIRKAVGDQFTVSAGQVGGTVKARVTSSNHVGAASALTDATDQVEGKPVNVGLPAVSGAAQTRSGLTVSPGAWSALPAAELSYQWQRCRGSDCSDIADATSLSYTTSREDVGARLRTKVTASNTHGSESVFSVPSGIVKVALFTLTLNVQPGGKIRVAHSGVFCQGVCRMLVPEGTQVRLFDESPPSYVFEGFTGSSCSGDSCSFEMTQNSTVGANFSPSPTLSLKYSFSQQQLIRYESTTLNLEASVTPPTDLIRTQQNVRVCVPIPDTLTVPEVPENATLVGGRVCWALGAVTPPQSFNLSLTLKAGSRIGSRTITPTITGLNREVVPGRSPSGGGFVRVSVRR